MQDQPELAALNKEMKEEASNSQPGNEGGEDEMSEPQGDEIANFETEKEHEHLKQGSPKNVVQSPVEPTSLAKADQRASRTRLASTKLIGSIAT